MKQIALLPLLVLFLTPDLLAQCNSIPVAFNDPVEFFGRPISVEPMWNDLEPDGEALELSVVSHNCSSPPTGPPISVLVENGTLRLIPSQVGYASACTVSYRIEDEHGFTATAQVQIQAGGAIFLDGFETGTIGRWQ